jgi:hypothetical protein
MDNVEVRGVVQWIDPKNGNTEPDIFGLEPDPNYQHARVLYTIVIDFTAISRSFALTRD